MSRPHELIYTGWASLRSANSRGRLFLHELWRCGRTAGSSPAFGALGMTKTLAHSARSFRMTVLGMGKRARAPAPHSHRTYAGLLSDFR